jgi:hypothetical protein
MNVSAGLNNATHPFNTTNNVEVTLSEDKLSATDIRCSKDAHQYAQKQASLAIYFLRTSLSQ